jgi:hypothetical protein
MRIFLVSTVFGLYARKALRLFRKVGNFSRTFLPRASFLNHARSFFRLRTQIKIQQGCKISNARLFLKWVGARAGERNGRSWCYDGQYVFRT